MATPDPNADHNLGFNRTFGDTFADYRMSGNHDTHDMYVPTDSHDSNESNNVHSPYGGHGAQPHRNRTPHDLQNHDNARDSHVARNDPYVPSVAASTSASVPLSRALDEAVSGLYEKSSASAKVSAIWAQVVGPIGMRHTRGLYVKEPEATGNLPTLFVYLDSNVFVYEYGTDHILYEQRLAYLGFPVKQVEFRLSASAGRPASRRPLESPTMLDEGEPPARPLDELAPLDERDESWARRSVAGLPDDLANAIYGAMTATMRRNQDERRH